MNQVTKHAPAARVQRFVRPRCAANSLRINKRCVRIGAMSEEKLLPSYISEYKRQTMYPVMKDFYDVENPSKDVAQKFVQAFEAYLEYIHDSPYSTGPGDYDVPDRHEFMPIVREEIQWAASECTRM